MQDTIPQQTDSLKGVPYIYETPPAAPVPEFISAHDELNEWVPEKIKAAVQSVLKEKKDTTLSAMVPSILQAERVEPHIRLYERKSDSHGLEGILITLGFFIWALSRFLDREGWRDVVASVAGGNVLREKLRDDKVYTPPFPLKYALLGHILLAIFAAAGAHWTGYVDTWAETLITGGVALGLSLCFFTLKITLVTLGGNVFEIRQNAIVHNHFLYARTTLEGALLFTGLCIMFMSGNHSVIVFHMIPVVVVLLSSVYTITQCFVNFSYKNTSHYFYILLYLCTLEILPLATLGGYLITRTYI
ncbi:MAG: DUF4271 domain-containing protein [Flavobacteriales bacterium]